MSSRVLKKLQGDLDLLEKNKTEDSVLKNRDEVDGSEESSDNAKKPLNRFDLLHQQSFSESEVKEDDNDTECCSNAINAPNKFTKKKKRKRKKKNVKQSQISSEDNDLTDRYLSEIDSHMDKTHHTPNYAVVQKCENYKALLSVEHKNLNPNIEMRRTFGKKVVKIEKRSRGKPLLKSTYLVAMKDGWPPITKDIISMKAIRPPANDDSATQWFLFEHSHFYRNIQSMFFSAVQSTDSDFLVDLIKKCPYHVDSLVQLSELCKMTENFAMASELIERAVLILETSLHSSFSLTSGQCRLDYKNQENRSFFIVLFKYAQFLESRMAVRTAFEISKLILSLNPDTDPMAIVLIIDYYAIRCKQYAWLIKFYDEWDNLKNLSQLPNMAYSYALAQFYLNGDNEEADKSLQYALLMFPSVLKMLLDELSVQTDQRLTASSYFNSSISGNQSPALQQLGTLYVCRAKIIWRDSKVLPWLERNVNAVLDKVDANHETINEYVQKRHNRYGNNPPRAILRHVVLSDFKEKVPLAQFVLTEKDPIMMYDPLAPLDSVNSYEKKSSGSSPSTSNSRPVSMFFQSMLPDFNLRQQQQRLNDDALAVLEVAELRLNEAEEGAGVQSYQDITQSLASIVDAMRDFLSTIRIRQPDNEENGSSEEDSSDYDEI